MSDELKPCHTCGKIDYSKIIRDQNMEPIWINCCTEYNEDIEWNTRPIEDALEKRIAELEGNNKILKAKLHSIFDILTNRESPRILAQEIDIDFGSVDDE